MAVNECDSLISARDDLANIRNTWLYHHEMDKARLIAKTASEQECQVELDRLHACIESRICAWRYSQ